jgi:hypothetical protein
MAKVEEVVHGDEEDEPQEPLVIGAPLDVSKSYIWLRLINIEIVSINKGQSMVDVIERGRGGRERVIGGDIEENGE